MPYPKTGPFNNGAAPGITATFLNNLETWLGTALQADADVVGTAPQQTNVTLGGSQKVVAVWNATDGKEYEWIIQTGGNLALYNVTDGVTVFTVEHGGHLTTNSNTVWDQGNDGSGSGLDADTVDGIHASAFVQQSSGLVTETAFAATGTTLYSGGNYAFVAEAGAVYFDGGDITSTGSGTLNVVQLHGNTGGYLNAVSFFSGSGSGTFNHGLGQTPRFVGIIVDQTNAQGTVGVDTLGSTSVHVNMFNSGAWLGIAVA